MITLKTILWFVIITAFALVDFTIIKKGSRPNYLLSFCIRGFVAIVYLAFMWETQYDLRTLNLILFCLSTFWVTFDIIMGSLLHGDPFYIGPNSGWLDRFAHVNQWTNIAYWVLKILALYIAVQTCINIYTKFE
jgi:hypothetical protein